MEISNLDCRNAQEWNCLILLMTMRAQSWYQDLLTDDVVQRMTTSKYENFFWVANSWESNRSKHRAAKLPMAFQQYAVHTPSTLPRFSTVHVPYNEPLNNVHYCTVIHYCTTNLYMCWFKPGVELYVILRAWIFIVPSTSCMNIFIVQYAVPQSSHTP